MMTKTQQWRKRRTKRSLLHQNKENPIDEMCRKDCT